MVFDSNALGLFTVVLDRTKKKKKDLCLSIFCLISVLKRMWLVALVPFLGDNL